MSAWRVPRQRDVDPQASDAEWVGAVRAEIGRTPAGAHLTDTTWLALARGETAGEGVAALTHVARCAECRDVLRGVRALRQESTAIPGVAPVMPRRAAWPRWLAAAAVVAMLGAGWLARRPDLILGTTAVVDPPTTARTPSATAVPPAPAARPDWLRATPPAIALYSPGALTMRGGGRGTFPDALAEALVPWRAGRYADAANRLARLDAAYPEAVEVPFYQGVAWLLSESPSRAVGPLRRAREAAPPRLRADAAWYLGLALLDTRSPEAMAAFVEACEAGHARGCQAARHLSAGQEGL